MCKIHLVDKKNFPYAKRVLFNQEIKIKKEHGESMILANVILFFLFVNDCWNKI